MNMLRIPVDLKNNYVHMKLNNYAGALICAILLMFCSCGEDFLYRAPQGRVDKEVLKNAQGVDMLITAAYHNLTQTGWGSSIFNWVYGGIYGGDANTGASAGSLGEGSWFEAYIIFTSNSYLNEKWTWVYRGSKHVELALKIIDDVTDTNPNLKKIRQGELYFLRALFYFEGVKVFGPYMPYIDETNKENDPKVYNDKDIYPNILADADKAIANLPDKPAELGRTYSWAAKALKAKILMQVGRMSEAKPILADILNNGNTASGLKYALSDDLNDNWSCAMDNKSPESVFEIQFTNDGNNNGNTGMSLCYPHNGPGGCCGFYQPSFELVNSYQVDDDGLPFLNAEYRSRPSVTTLIDDGPPDFSVNNKTISVDPRLDFSVGRVGIPYKDYGLTQSMWVRDYYNGGVFLPKKHVYSQAEADAGLGRTDMSYGWSPGSAMNIQYLSVRDAMLLYAECLANDGDLSGAMSWVNKIRERAALPVNIIYQEDGTPAAKYSVKPYPATHAAFTNKDVCIKAVRMERKLELAMEGQRWFDLARWGGDYMNAEIDAYLKYESNFIRKFKNKTPLAADKTMFPIPQYQIEYMGTDKNGRYYLRQSDPWK